MDPMTLLDQSRSLLKELQPKYPEVTRVDTVSDGKCYAFRVVYDPDRADETDGIAKTQRFPKDWHGKKVMLLKQSSTENEGKVL